jgi:hypothetical protein
MQESKKNARLEDMYSTGVHAPAIFTKTTIECYRLDGPCSIFDRVKIFLSLTVSRSTLGPTQLPLHWVLGGLILVEVKQQGREADHSLPSSAEIKKSGAILPPP